MNVGALIREKRTCADVAVKSIRSGMRVYLGGGAGIPQRLACAMTARGPELREVEVDHVFSLGSVDYLSAHSGSFRHNALFIGENARAAVAEGRADYTPIFLSEIPKLFVDGTLPLDVALIQVSEPDEHGYCSFGVEVGITKPAALAARTVIAEMNAQMPRVFGDSFIHLSRIDALVEADYPLPITTRSAVPEVYCQIGAHVASLIPDGATLQLGIGALPDAVLANLQDKKHLGIHSELFSDGVIDLVERGIVTGERKSLHRGKIVAGMLFGSARLYDFVHDNGVIELQPSDYVNDPFIIAQHDNMIAVNSALEVDLTGQVCADSIGTQFYSGIGGQVDFIRGAARSKGGKPIIALPATARSGQVSRITPQLQPGAGVVTSRGDVHYVVTEYGVAYLHGKTIRQRAKALIAIAAPSFRDELERYARAQNWW
jgi:4-hydroxybutyrate CoA-transferase